jgi:hypothetical protein
MVQIGIDGENQFEVTGSCEKMGLAKQFLVSAKSRSLKSNQYNVVLKHIS